MELLAPAGNVEKLKYAYLYGADAAYIGIKNFSLRAKADNLYDQEYKIIREIKGGKKLYGALNIYFHETDMDRLRASLDYIGEYPFDAFIISDIGCINLLKGKFPDTPLHLSTQANCTNSEAAKLYRDLGFTRIILGREVTLKEIEKIKKAVPNVELEAFVHGAMCLAYSGRCFLSSYLAGRSANKGYCSHPCRWSYRYLEEEERPGEYFPVVENDGFTTILSSKDLCMFDHLQEMIQAGIDSFKIEGRMKSIYYTALVTRSYRKALDVLIKNIDEDLSPFREELTKASHREFTTGFYFDKSDVEIPTEKSYVGDYQFVAAVSSITETGLFKLDVKNKIKSDDLLEYIGPDISFVQDHGFVLLDENNNPLEKVNHGSSCFLRTDALLKPGYIIRKPVIE